MKQEIEKSNYVFICLFSIIIGLIGNAIFSTIGIFNGFNYYTAVYMGISLLVVGFGVGLSVARAFNIKGIDEKEVL